MHLCIYVHVYVYLYEYMKLLVFAAVSLHLQYLIFTYLHTYLSMHANKHTSYVCKYARTYESMYVCSYICTHIRTYIVQWGRGFFHEPSIKTGEDLIQDEGQGEGGAILALRQQNIFKPHGSKNPIVLYQEMWLQRWLHVSKMLLQPPRNGSTGQVPVLVRLLEHETFYRSVLGKPRAHLVHHVF